MSGQEISKALTFITPAFLAGANQSAPEIRAPSIRGALRWWFRVLAGGRNVRKEEEELFGGVHGADGPVASAISVWVEDVAIKNNQEKLPLPGALSYIGFFPEQNDRTVGGHYIGAGSTFTLRIREVRSVPEELWARLGEAVQAFVWVGALGLRATRGFGRLAEQDNHLPTAQAFRAWAKALRERGIFLYEGRCEGGDAHVFLAEQLKTLRRDCDLRPKDPNARALGDATKCDRQASALRLCPVKTADAGVLPFFLYTDSACSGRSLQKEIDRFCADPQWIKSL